MKKNCGYIRISRCLEEHPVVGVHVRDGKYTLGWLRLLWRAAYKPRKVQRGRETITLDRGQISISERALAADFGWSYKEVRTFIQTLKKHDMIIVSAGAQRGAQGGAKKGAQMGASWPVITICNYDEYQAYAGEDGAEKGAQGGAHIGAQTGADSNKGNKYNNPSEYVSSSFHSEDTSSALPTGSGPDAPLAGEGPGQIDLEELTTPGRGEPAPVAKVEKASKAKPSVPATQVQAFNDRYRQIAEKVGLPVPHAKITPKRAKQIAKLIEHFGFDAAMDGIEEISKSKLAAGNGAPNRKTGKVWPGATLPWILSDLENFTKLSEGLYRDPEYRSWSRRNTVKDWREEARPGETLRQLAERLNRPELGWAESNFPDGYWDEVPVPVTETQG